MYIFQSHAISFLQGQNILQITINYFKLLYNHSICWLQWTTPSVSQTITPNYMITATVRPLLTHTITDLYNITEYHMTTVTIKAHTLNW